MDTLNFSVGIEELFDKFWTQYEVDVRNDKQLCEGIPATFVQQNIDRPLLDIVDLSRKLQRKYDADWERNRKRDIEEVQKRVMKTCLEAGVSEDIVRESQRCFDYSAFDCPRLLDIDEIIKKNSERPPLASWAENLTSESTPTSTSEEADSPGDHTSSTERGETSEPQPQPITAEGVKQASTTKGTKIFVIAKKATALTHIIKVECGICNDVSLSKAQFMEHWNEKHVELKNKLVVDPAPRCVGCLKGFTTCKALTCHVGGIGGDKCTGEPDSSVVGELAAKLRRCQECGKHYKNTESASTCLAKNHNALRCPLCLLTFKDEMRKNFVDHVKEFHSEKNDNGKTVYPCKFCKVVITAFRELVEHLAENHYNPCLRPGAVITTNVASAAAAAVRQFTQDGSNDAEKGRDTDADGNSSSRGKDNSTASTQEATTATGQRSESISGTFMTMKNNPSTTATPTGVKRVNAVSPNASRGFPGGPSPSPPSTPKAMPVAKRIKLSNSPLQNRFQVIGQGQNRTPTTRVASPTIIGQRSLPTPTQSTPAATTASAVVMASGNKLMFQRKTPSSAPTTSPHSSLTLTTTPNFVPRGGGWISGPGGGGRPILYRATPPSANTLRFRQITPSPGTLPPGMRTLRLPKGVSVVHHRPTTTGPTATGQPMPVKTVKLVSLAPTIVGSAGVVTTTSPMTSGVRMVSALPNTIRFVRPATATYGMRGSNQPIRMPDLRPITNPNAHRILLAATNNGGGGTIPAGMQTYKIVTTSANATSTRFMLSSVSPGTIQPVTVTSGSVLGQQLVRRLVSLASSTATAGITVAAPSGIVVTPTNSQQTTNPTATLVVNMAAATETSNKEADNQGPSAVTVTLTTATEGSPSENTTDQVIPVVETLNTETTPTTDPSPAVDGGEEGGNGNENEILGF